MSSHPPGLPGLPMIPGLPGPSGVFGHALTQADRRRPEAEHKPLSLNIPGFLHPSAGAAHLALPPPMLTQSNLPPHSLSPGVSGANSITTNTTTTLPSGSGGAGISNNNNNATTDNSNNGSAGVLDLHHRAIAAAGVTGVANAHNPGGTGTSAGAVVTAVTAAAATGSGGAAATGGAGVGEIRVDASRCPVCFRHFDDRWKLERHARVHTGERPFACSRCTKTFTRKEHLTRHELSHDGGIRNAPPAGGSTAGTQAAVNALVLYRGVEGGQGNTVAVRGDGYRCPVCFRHFGDRWKLERHARVHTGERPFSCGRCGNSFRRKEHLVRHERSHDGGPPNTPPTGGSTAGTQAAVNALVLYRGAEGGEGSNAPVAVRGDGCRCPVCFRHFGDRWKLERHARVHTGERPFSCGRCGNSFRRKEHLVRHERSHDAPLNALLPPGGSSSGANSSAVDVYRSGAAGAAGTGTVPLRVDACRCPVCFRHFGDRWKLERHARVHTGERPFSCTRCGKAFTTKEHLVRHEMSHSGEKPYSCSVCGKAFTRKDHVDRHFKKTHCRPKYTDL